METNQDEQTENVRDGVGGKRGLERLIAATRYSAAGLSAAWRSEEAFRQEAILAMLMIPTAFWLGTTALERLVLIGSVFLVIIVELLNTAVEYTVDRIGTERHPLSGRAKDMGSAAVLLSLIFAATAWGMLICERFC